MSKRKIKPKERRRERENGIEWDSKTSFINLVVVASVFVYASSPIFPSHKVFKNRKDSICRRFFLAKVLAHTHKQVHPNSHWLRVEATGNRGFGLQKAKSWRKKYGIDEEECRHLSCMHFVLSTEWDNCVERLFIVALLNATDDTVERIVETLSKVLAML